MRWMCEIEPRMGFDCASVCELSEVSHLVSGKNIIYAQPCKKLQDISAAAHVATTVVDSVEEVEKLAEGGWKNSVIVRMLVDDAGSKQPFSKKFGAPRAWLPRIYEAARMYNLTMTGFSFHVGSECEAPQQYKTAIEECKYAAGIAKQYGYNTSLIDIGGGFLPNSDAFSTVASIINAAKQREFPVHKDEPAVQWIAEPGRFLAGPTHTLYTTVIGKKPVYPEPLSHMDPAYRITIDESVYGVFSNIPFDHQTPVLECMRAANHGETKRPTVVFGRTCDSGDCIGTDIPLYEVQVGDVLRVENMGAYTTVTASEFNGFPKPTKQYDL